MEEDREKRYFKIYGERNSGTIYLQSLLQLNLEATVLPGVAPRWLRRHFGRYERVIDFYFRLTFPRNLGWKHRVAPSPQELQRVSLPTQQILFLIIAKNPYAWLLSLFRRPYHYQGELTTFHTFLTKPWPTVGRENHPAPFASPMAMWNAKYASYLRLARTAPTLFIRYEDLLAGPEALLRSLSLEHHISWRTSSFVNMQASTKGESGREFEDYRQRYLEERWREELSPQDIEIIRRSLDPAVVEALGYPLDI